MSEAPIEFDMSEGEAPTIWEERFETQINTFFDEAIARVPNFVERNLKSLRKVMGRNLSPKTGVGDILVGMRNVASGVSKTVGGPDFSTTTYTHDKLTEAFEREVVSSEELQTLLNRLFTEFEDAMWEKAAEDLPEIENADDLQKARGRLDDLMEREIAHDPLLAQAIRAGVKLGVPATLGYVLFGRMGSGPTFGDAANTIYKKNLDLYHRVLMRIGRTDVPNWVGAVGWAGGILGTLAIGGLMEYTLNSVRDIKGQYIRQLNSARYVLLYGEDPSEPEGRGLLHIVRGFERQFDGVPQISKLLEPSKAEEQETPTN